jgi:hypothetical protein
VLTHPIVRDPRLRARAGVIAVAAGALLAAGIYTVHDPNQGGFPACPLYTLTGVLCPGCGSQRGLHALLTGDLLGAFGANALMVLALPVLLYAYVAWTNRAFGSGAMPALRMPARALLVVVLAFTVVRNLPFGAALAP